MKTLNQKNQNLVFKAIKVIAKINNLKFVYLEDVYKIIDGLTEMQIKKYVDNLKKENYIHYFGSLEDCTQLHIK